MLEFFLLAGQYPDKFLFCVLLALIPSFAWYFIFGHRHKHSFGRIMLTFIAGMMSGAIILFYQHFWGSQFDFIFFTFEPENFDASIRSKIMNPILASFFVFMSVGFLEEYLKHWVVKVTDHRIFESIDDVIEFSIISALGFAFLENIGYFFSLVVNGQEDNLLPLFAVRSIFVVFVHILCSGIYGYFYGLGFFAKPVMNDMEKEGVRSWIPEIFHKILHMKKDIVYRDEMISLGLIVSMTLHGLYDFLLHVDFSIGTIGQSEIRLYFIVLPLILVFGFGFLSYLLEKKIDQKKFGRAVIAYETSP